MKKSIAILSLVLLPAWALAATDCSSPTGEAEATALTEATQQAVKAEEKKRQAELDADLDARTKALGWSNQRKLKLFNDMLESPKFKAFEEEKKPVLAEVRSIISETIAAGKDNKEAGCKGMLRMNAVFEKIKEINGRQYDFMAAEIAAAK